MSTCNRLDLETRGSWPIVRKKPPQTPLDIETTRRRLGLFPTGEGIFKVENISYVSVIQFLFNVV